MEFPVELIYAGIFGKIYATCSFPFYALSVYTQLSKTLCLLIVYYFLTVLSLSDSVHYIHPRQFQRVNAEKSIRAEEKTNKPNLGYTAFIWDIYNQSWVQEQPQVGNLISQREGSAFQIRISLVIPVSWLG